jgi:hypothetical protein
LDSSIRKLEAARGAFNNPSSCYGSSFANGKFGHATDLYIKQLRASRTGSISHIQLDTVERNTRIIPSISQVVDK